jgi:hypothetical protein
MRPGRHAAVESAPLPLRLVVPKSVPLSYRHEMAWGDVPGFGVLGIAARPVRAWRFRPYRRHVDARRLRSRRCRRAGCLGRAVRAYRGIFAGRHDRTGIGVAACGPRAAAGVAQRSRGPQHGRARAGSGTACHPARARHRGDHRCGTGALVHAGVHRAQCRSGAAPDAAAAGEAVVAPACEPASTRARTTGLSRYRPRSSTTGGSRTCSGISGRCTTGFRNPRPGIRSRTGVATGRRRSGAAWSSAHRNR